MTFQTQEQAMHEGSKQETEEGPDFVVANHGSIFMVRPVTQAAKDWVEEHMELEGWQWLGNAFAVEHRYIDNLVAGIQGDGLTVA